MRQDSAWESSRKSGDEKKKGPGRVWTVGGQRNGQPPLRLVCTVHSQRAGARGGQRKGACTVQSIAKRTISEIAADKVPWAHCSPAGTCQGTYMGPCAERHPQAPATYGRAGEPSCSMYLLGGGFQVVTRRHGSIHAY